MRPTDNQETIEARLRAGAPDLPPELRAQILHRCLNQRRNTSTLPWQRRWQGAGAFASLVLFCWVMGGRLDAQNRAMITGSEGRPSASASAASSESADFVVALRWRLEQLALLLHDRHSG
jgi:hypothetical protein